jgi:hypothetical protein
MYLAIVYKNFLILNGKGGAWGWWWRRKRIFEREEGEGQKKKNVLKGKRDNEINISACVHLCYQSN